MDAAVIPQAVAGLRKAQRGLGAMSQAEVVMALAEFGRCWRDPGFSCRREAEALTCPYPFAMTRVSLDALLDSLTPEALWQLIDGEGVRDDRGAPLIGHIIAGNTPLLAWTSLLRALLMRSASLVKLPSGDAAGWGRLFVQSLLGVAPTLASCITLMEWPGGSTGLDRALCENVDVILAYGSDKTVAALQALCPPETPFVGYGHRVSFGLLLEGADEVEAARGFATDVLLYDQGGCLSPQTLFVEGTIQRTRIFASHLASALDWAVREYPLPHRAPQAAARVREARLLAKMEAGASVWEDPTLRWTVIARPDLEFTPSPTHGVVSVQPLLSVADLPTALSPVRASLQGCAVACGDASSPPELGMVSGVSYICCPGRLQAPPLSWPEDGRPVLRSLRPGAATAGVSPGLGGTICGK